MKLFNLIIPFLLCFVFSFSANAQSNAYLKIGDIKGESESRDHKDWIIIESFSQGVSTNNNSTTGRLIARRSNFEDLVITKKLDKSSPKLMMKCASGEVIPELELELTGADGRSYYKIKMSDVMVTSISTSAGTQSKNELREEVSFNYTKISWEYTDKSGTKIVEGFDVKLNRKT